MRLTGDVGAPWRAPMLVLGFLSLFAGIAAGLVRLGWPLPAASLAPVHGPLMVSGFFGTVISLERAVALRERWAYGAPLFSALGALAAIVAAPVLVAPALAVAGSAVMLAASVAVYRRQREFFTLTLTLALGALSWLAGNLVWLGGAAVYAAVPWWVAFLVLTIAGERLELSRFLPPSPRAQRLFAALIIVLFGGVTASLVDRAAGTLALGAALVGLALWLARQDVTRRTVRTRGLTRFIAICLLSGYVWLALSGASMLLSGGLAYGGTAYDAALHAVLLGFVFSMVIGHAPIILPAVLRVAVPYSPAFYTPLALLHVSLAIRLVGDWMGMPPWRAWGGALNAIALLVFVLGTVAAVIRGRVRRGRSRAAMPDGSPQ